ncbi:hypothetical protein L195_g045951, partial [Trifolium pratense]
MKNKEQPEVNKKTVKQEYVAKAITQSKLQQKLLTSAQLLQKPDIIIPLQQKPNPSAVHAEKPKVKIAANVANDKSDTSFSLALDNVVDEIVHGDLQTNIPIIQQVETVVIRDGEEDVAETQFDIVIDEHVNEVELAQPIHVAMVHSDSSRDDEETVPETQTTMLSQEPLLKPVLMEDIVISKHGHSEQAKIRPIKRLIISQIGNPEAQVSLKVLCTNHKVGLWRLLSRKLAIIASLRHAFTGLQWWSSMPPNLSDELFG